mgnify:CR=1 FL=1|jgi:predicted nucleotidyltransferase
MNKLAHSMAQRIVQKFALQKVIMFDSTARGEDRPNSDIDLLVVLDCNREQKREMQAIRKELREFNVSKDIVVANPKELNKYKVAWWTVYHPALREGVVLYER